MYWDSCLLVLYFWDILYGLNIILEVIFKGVIKIIYTLAFESRLAWSHCELSFSS